MQSFDLVAHLKRQIAFSRLVACGADTNGAAEIACNLIVGKQTRNEGRDWPDWRGQSQDHAIEHVRGGAE